MSLPGWHGRSQHRSYTVFQLSLLPMGNDPSYPRLGQFQGVKAMADGYTDTSFLSQLFPRMPQTSSVYDIPAHARPWPPPELKHCARLPWVSRQDSFSFILVCTHLTQELPLGDELAVTLRDRRGRPWVAALSCGLGRWRV